MLLHFFRFLVALLKIKTKLTLVNVQTCILTSFWSKPSEYIDNVGQLLAISAPISINYTIFQQGKKIRSSSVSLFHGNWKIFNKNLKKSLCLLSMPLIIILSVSTIQSDIAILAVIFSYHSRNVYIVFVLCLNIMHFQSIFQWLWVKKENNLKIFTFYFSSSSKC